MFNISSENSDESAVLNDFGCYRKFKKGHILLWQGDKLDYIFVIKNGTVKVYSIYSDGRIYTYGMLGIGALVGVPELLLGEESKVTIESIEDTDVIAVPVKDFQHLLSTNPDFSMLLIKRLARDLRNVAEKAEDFGLLSVLERLKRSLIKLAEEYGIKTDKGIRIKLDITHQEIGELIGANRTTITYFINELKRQGYLYKDGKHLIITNPENSTVPL
jgi:CRP/FNR family transcriptional regulator, cyclic AMP receptor protein